MAIIEDSSHKADQQERLALQMCADVARAFLEAEGRNGHLQVVIQLTLQKTSKIRQMKNCSDTTGAEDDCL